VILYLDTSSLVKIYLEEPGADLVREWVDAAEGIATSRVAYPEALSAFTRRREEGDLDSKAFGLVQESLRNDWTDFVLLPLNEQRAGTLVVRHLLRGFDAIHLAAAFDLRDQIRGDSVVFSSYDRKLLRAARSEGIDSLVPWAEGESQ
jgi:uncharacterized protein